MFLPHHTGDVEEDSIFWNVHDIIVSGGSYVQPYSMECPLSVVVPMYSPTLWNVHCQWWFLCTALLYGMSTVSGGSYVQPYSMECPLSVVVPMYSPILWNVHDVTVSGGSYVQPYSMECP